MRILTVRQPWAHAIIFGGKNVENRVRNLAGEYRGPVAIHVALRDDDDWEDNIAAAFIPSAPIGGWPWPTYSAPYWANYGHIIGVVDLVGVHHGSALSTGCEHEVDLNGEGATYIDACSPWADLGLWHLCLANPRPLSEPIPYKGSLGLRRLDAHTIERIEAQL